jgi:UDP-N-acetylmuramate: L-alanyl-gamma-D-glutamyl-meso-diaminopimelate ligase
MHVHVLGICGTFMGGLALLARALGHRVTGSDANVYPPMSTQLAAAGIALTEGYDPAQLEPPPDRLVIGNALSRGNPAVERALDDGLRYTSGAQWLAEEVLHGRWVLAVAGTHGKTTTASMLAWILDQAGLAPGFLIGGVPLGFGVSARLGDGPFFVVEADEYDTAFFDKRSKFVHYRPRTLVLNNLEFDHADIFTDLSQIQRQFHHLVRTVPGSGLIVAPRGDAALADVLAMGCWTPVEQADLAEGSTWGVRRMSDDGSRFTVVCEGREIGEVRWCHTGLHNVANALSALAAARHAGVAPAVGVAALSGFQGGACACTTTSPTTRRPSARRSTACAGRSATRASSRSSSRAPIRCGSGYTRTSCPRRSPRPTGSSSTRHRISAGTPLRCSRAWASGPRCTRAPRTSSGRSQPTRDRAITSW